MNEDFRCYFFLKSVLQGGATRVPRTHLTIDEEGMIPMFEAAMFLLEEVNISC